MKNYEWIISLVDKATGPMERILNKADGMGKKFESTGTSASKLFYQLGTVNFVADAFSKAEQAMTKAIEPGQKFESAMAEVKAITGSTDEQMKLMKRSAMEMATQLGGSATNNLLSYKGILSELGPQIAENPAALASMGRSVSILSKSMGGDAVGSMKALTTGLQQFNVDLSNPEKAAKAMTFQMNVMAAAANAGAAEVPQIADSLKTAGVAASGARISFIETNAAIQVLAKGGLKGAEAGTALRNVIGKLGEGRFLPKDTLKELKAAGVDISKLSDKSIPFRDRLGELQKIMGDSALVTKLFGTENMNAANILLKGIPAIGEFEKQLTGTNAAVDAANILLNTNASRMDRVKAHFENVAIAAFDALKPMLPYIQSLGMLVTSGTALAPVFMIIGQGLKWTGVKLWGLAVDFGKTGLSALRFGARMALTGVQGVGSFIISLARGIIGIRGFAAGLRLQAVLALGVFQAKIRAFSFKTFIAGLWSSGTAAIRAGGAWLWSAMVGLPAMAIGFLKATSAQWALNVAMNANPIGAVVLGLLAIGTAVYLLIKHWDTVKQWFIGMGKWILENNPFSLLLTSIGNLFPGFKNWLSRVWDMFTTFLKKMFGHVKFIWDKIAPFLGLGSFNLPAIDSGLFDGEDPGSGDGSPDALDKNGGVSDGLDKISGGGSKPTTVNITIHKFQDSIQIHTSNFKEGVNDAVAMLEEGLIRVANSANIVAVN